MVGPTNSYGAGGNDIYLYRVDSLGHTIWDTTYGSTGNDFPYMVNTTVDGGFIVAGFTTSYGAANEDLWLIKVHGDGSLHWTYQYGGINNSRQQVAWWVEQTDDDGFIISGHDQISLGNHQLLLIKTGPDPGVEEFTASNPIADALTVNPNPFTTFADIRYQMTDRGRACKLHIYDITGRLVADLSEQVSAIGHQSSVRWNGRDDFGHLLTAGVYFIRLTVGDHSKTEKVLLVR